MRDLRSEVMEEFEAAQSLAATRREDWLRTESVPLYQSLEAIRRAYRERNAAKGLCRSCPNPVVDGLQVCAEHRRKNNEAMRRRTLECKTTARQTIRPSRS